MEVLHSEGITYDPRDPNAWAPHGEHGRLASTAKRAWEHLCLVQEEVDSFDRMLEDSAARQRRDAEKQLLAVLEASGLHNQFMHTARNLANRWRIVGLARTVTYGVRWIRRTLRQTAT
ncbi:hypothetical protein PHLCEN_2v1437 [Hermanssonia centrifuga]|uniref:Uncharacterized protein n=1 Tax=Hermanssonia centrifuga TaxID=98765 RepID=A0A2R6S020_9APHY|nr:hypothetical protein PHLCEN_2v1437 [Hermanssonia centrifuga]